MFHDEFNAAGKAALGKFNLLKNNPLGYVIASCMAGMYIGIGAIMMGIVGGYLAGQPAQKLICGITFSVGLCFVTMGGAELFTGNNFIMAVGSMTKNVSWIDTIRVWVVCYIGNLIGSVITALLFNMTGIGQSNEAIGEFLANAAAGKMAGTPAALFSKAIFCNILVCIAIWCGVKMKSEGARMFMNFCCVATFVTCGFEHSVANMTFLTIGLLNPLDKAITFGGFFYNLAIVTVGNMVGGIIFVAVPYMLISAQKQK